MIQTIWPCCRAISSSWQSPARGVLHYVAADSRLAAFFSPMDSIDRANWLQFHCLHVSLPVCCRNLAHCCGLSGITNSGPRQLFGEWLPGHSSVHFCTRLADARLSSRMMDRCDGTLPATRPEAARCSRGTRGLTQRSAYQLEALGIPRAMM